MVKKTMQATQKLPTAKADIRPEDAKKSGPSMEDSLRVQRHQEQFRAAHPKKPEPVTEERDDDLDDTTDEPDRLPSEADLAAMNADSRAMLDNAMDASSPMSLADVNAILADNYPGYTPTDPRGTSAGLQFTLPDGKSINVQRKRVKACANMEELRAYVGGLL